MNFKIIIKLSLLLIISQAFTTFAQEANQSIQKQRSIIKELNSDTPFQGSVSIYQDEAIQGILAKSAPRELPVFTSEDGAYQYVKMRGFKIQVFSGNNQRESKDEAYSKQKLINDTFEDIETDVFFKSPRWILRAGNFKTREEANILLEQFIEEFPNFGKEMYIVSDTVKIPL